MNYLKIQKELIEQVESRLNSDGVDYSKEEVGGDVLFVVFKESIKQFTIEICFDSTEFFKLPQIYQWYHADQPDYSQNVKALFNELLETVTW